MVALRKELEEVLLRFAGGQADLDSVEIWLALHVQAVGEDADDRVRELADAAWHLLEGYGHRELTEEQLRAEMGLTASAPRAATPT